LQAASASNVASSRVVALSKNTDCPTGAAHAQHQDDELVVEREVVLVEAVVRHQQP
jgi:hypothetical protein